MPRWISLHRDGTAADVRQHDRRDRLVVRGELALGDAVVREQHLLGVRDHGISRTTSRADLSVRTPSNRGMAKLAVHRPLDEGNLHDDLGPHPVRANARQSDGFGERRFRDLDRIEPRAKFQQQLGIEARADLPGEDEVVALEISDEQRAQADASALRIGESADHELLRRLALHLQPVRRAAMLVLRIAPFRDHAFPSLAARALPGLGSVSSATRSSGGSKGQRLQQRAAFVQRQLGHVATLKPWDVKHVVNEK